MRSQLFLSVGAAVSLAAAAPSVVSRTPCPPQVPNLAELLQDPELGFDSRTLITFPGQSNFTEATERWAQFAVPTYSAAVSPATEQDVVTLVSFLTVDMNNTLMLTVANRCDLLLNMRFHF